MEAKGKTIIKEDGKTNGHGEGTVLLLKSFPRYKLSVNE